MKRFLFAAVAASALLAASQASAALIADFQLNGSLANGAGGAVTLTNNGATLGATGLTFGADQGPTLGNLGTLEVYDLQTRFSFDAVNGYRKIADFFDLTLDTGFYVLNGQLNFYPVVTGGDSLAAGELVTVRLTRAADDTVTAYLNGVQSWSFDDTGDLAVINDTLHLFIDDTQVSGEASSGFVDYVRLSTDIAVVPEPATWALMIGGFGFAGAALRRRRGLAA